MVNDHLSDFITRIRNGYMAGNDVVETRATKMIARVAEVLKTEGYLKSVTVADGVLKAELKYAGSKPAISGIRRVSKPGARVYSSISDVRPVWSGLGISILSTPKGVLSHKQARKLHVGGEIVAQVW